MSRNLKLLEDTWHDDHYVHYWKDVDTGEVFEERFTSEGLEPCDDYDE